MNPLARIRKEILRITQSELAAVTGVRQATVSRWEKGELEPSREQLAAIRTYALSCGMAWDDLWFFEPRPAPSEPEAA